MDSEDALRARLQTWIAEHGRSARWLSLAAHLGENAVGRYLEGATKRLSLESVIALAAAMGVDQGVLLGEAGYAPVPAPPEDVAGQVDRLLQQGGVADSSRESIMHLVRLVLARNGDPSGGSRPSPSVSPTRHHHN